MRFAWLERIAILVAGVALAVVVIALVSGYLTGNDRPSVAGGPQSGRLYSDQGNALLFPGSPDPAYDSNPPTSGPHVPIPVVADQVALSNDQLLEALAAGNVVFLYGSAKPPVGLRALATRLSGPFTPALALGGQAVILARRPGTTGVIALAWTRMLRLSGVDTTLLSGFAQQWLGRGAGQ